MSRLASERCVPCRGDAQPVGDDEARALMRELAGWQLVEREGVRRLEKTYAYPDFAQALAFTNRVGALAEAEGHHPALLTEWGRVTVAWWTHAIRGLHRNDFVMAARTDTVQTAAGHTAGR